jgi:hypothetical protein
VSNSLKKSSDKIDVNPFKNADLNLEDDSKRENESLKEKKSLKDEKDNHIKLKYKPEEMDKSEYQQTSDDEDMDDDYSDEDPEENLDELLFLEAVAWLNENISMLTVNSTEIFTSFQQLVNETNTLASTLGEFTTQLKKVSDEQQKKIDEAM